MSTANEDASNRPRLGEILLKRHILTEKQLAEALTLQRKNGGYIGEILIKLGHLKERDVVVALVVQCSLPYIAINKYEIDKKILQLIPENTAKKLHVMPLDRVGDVLSVVMDDPLNEISKKELEQVTGCKIATFIATRTEIDQAIARWYKKDL